MQSNTLKNNKKIVNKIIHWLSYLYYLLVKSTVSIEVKGFHQIRNQLDRELNPCLGCAHTVLLPSVLALEAFPCIFLASKSQDGEIISAILEKRGFSMARGSSSRGGVAGLKGLIRRQAHATAIGLTYDGPKGPPYVPKRGILLCIRQASGDFFVIHTKFKGSKIPFFPSHIRLKSWDRFHLIVPFAKIRMTCELYLTKEESSKPKETWEKSLLKRIESEAKSFYSEDFSGAPDLSPY